MIEKKLQKKFIINPVVKMTFFAKSWTFEKKSHCMNLMFHQCQIYIEAIFFQSIETSMGFKSFYIPI